MTISQVHQQIGVIDATARGIATLLNQLDFRASLRAADSDTAAHQAEHLRLRLRQLFTRRYQLECRIPTPETLGERAYQRALALGMEIEVAESDRLVAIRAARKN